MLSPVRQLKGVHYAWITVLLVLPPLAGTVLVGRSLSVYFTFPPVGEPAVHGPFSPLIFILLSLFVAAVCAPFFYRFFSAGLFGQTDGPARSAFPRWGLLGIFILLVSWILAWNRFFFFEPLQRYTFFPLWSGYILVVSGLTCRRKGSCLLQCRSRFFLALFAASALFWWYFEYLNRFVRNWHYLTGGNISALNYALHASISFATVLPAVISTTELLTTIPRLTAPFAFWRPIILPVPKRTGLLLIVVSVTSLGLLPLLPDYLFPLVWISPLLVIAGVRLIVRRPLIIAELAKGNWLPIVLPALAALVCGILWEMWNWKSLAHWQYSIPFVHRFQIFAMPLLGYAGYLPFGLECLSAAAIVQELRGESDGTIAGVLRRVDA